MGREYKIILIRPIASSEIINATDLAGRIYQEALAESFEAFAMKHRLFPAGVLGCFVKDTKLFWEGLGFKSVKTFDYALNTTAHEMILTSLAR